MRKLLATLTAFLLCAGTLLAQRTVTGRVTDDKGAPIPNVSVVVRGTPTGTVTKADGTFSLTVPANARQLEISSLGFTTQTIDLGTSSTYNVSMATSGASDLEEVVVTGISRVKKSQFAGAANKIAAKEIENRPVGSFDQLFQGRAPGVLALTGSGQPGQPTNVIIRGTSSVSGGTTPLYIVDGIPVEAGVFQSLNPNDFASIDILRDAATTSLYGSRGSAGVIVVTTKRGQSGKLQVTYDGQMGIKGRPEFAFRPMNTQELLQAQEDYGRVLGITGTATIPGWFYSRNNPRYGTLNPTQQQAADRILDSIRGINTNWADYIFRQGSFSNHQISLSGGTGKTRIYSSLGLYNEEGTTARTDMQRATFRNNVDYADDRFTLAVSSIIGYTKRNFQQSTTTNSTANPFLVTNIAVPYHLPFKPNGVDYNTGVGAKFAATNQLDLTRFDENYNDQIKVTLGMQMDYKITNNLNIGITGGVDFRETQATNYGSRLAFLRTPAATSSITTLAGFQTETMNRFLTMSVRPNITYRNTFADRHEIEVSAIGEYIQENAKGFNLTGFGIDPRTPNTPGAIQPGNAGNQLYIQAGGDKANAAISSGLGTLRYTFDDKYTITGSFRYDGSSKLPKNTRWQEFWSVGAIWDITKENFMQNIGFVNSLRLRGSYGGSGNHNNFPSYYLYQATYGTGSYSGLPTQGVSYVGNPNAVWESTWVLNFGLDYELFNRRVYGDFNWYDNRTKDLYVNRNLSIENTGGAAIDVNAGELQNTGFEWNINAEVIRKRDFVWTLFAQGAYNRNRLVSLGGEQPYESGTSFLQEGLPLGSHYEVGWAGVDAATGQPLYYDLEGKVTTVYNASNATTNWGTWEAPWKGGFGTRLNYKNLELYVLFSFQEGAYKMDNLEYFVENPVGFLAGGYNQSADLNFWKQPGDIASTPSPVYGTNFSSKLIHNASFMRLRDVTLSYTLPNNLLSKMKVVSRASVYVQANNLFIWTKWRGMDPEAGPANINLSEFPNPRAITGGLRVTF